MLAQKGVRDASTERSERCKHRKDREIQAQKGVRDASAERSERCKHRKE